MHDEPSTLAGDWHERPLLHFTDTEKKIVGNGGWLVAIIIVACWSVAVLVGTVLFFHLTGLHQ